MTTNKKNLVEALRARLAEIDVERPRLVTLLAMYEGGGSPPAQSLPKRTKSTLKASGTVNLFAPRSEGPTERLMAVVEETPGLRYGQVLDRAEVGMNTESAKPRRSLGSTLGSLVKRGKLKKLEGKYYPNGVAG